MKKILTVISLLAFVCILPIAGFANDPIIPGEIEPDNSGFSPEDFVAKQNAKESFISTQQFVDQSATTGFVKVNPTDTTKLDLDGQEYKFSHANNYYLFYKSESMIDEVFADAAALGLNAIRTWGFCDGEYKEGVSFQPTAGTYDSSGFAKMDYIFSKATEYDIKLIVPLVNNWDDFGGINQYVEWYLGRTPTYAEHDLFFTESTIKTWYKNYVSEFVNRYKDNPTLLTWELGNEPRAYTDNSGSILNPWIDEMAGYIKSIDSNHLVSSGIEGWYNYVDGVDFITSNSSSNIDIATFHLFPDHYNLTMEQSYDWITQRVNDAHNILNKPVYIGEFGKMSDGSRRQERERNNFYKNVYSTTHNAGGNGLGFWILYGDDYPDYDSFGVYYPGDNKTCNIIKDGTTLILTGEGGKGGGKGNGKGNGKGKNKTASSSMTASPTFYELQVAGSGLSSDMLFYMFSKFHGKLFYWQMFSLR